MQHRRSLTVGLAGASAVVAAMCREPTQTRIIARPSAVDAGPDVRTGPGSPVTVTTRFVGGSEWTVTWGDGGLDSGTLSGGDTLLRLTHSYATAGTYAIKVSGDSPEGDAVSDTLAAVVDATGVPQVLIGAGDIGECGPPMFLKHAQRTAAIIDTIPGTVFTLGDNAYPAGTVADYAQCYAPTWGQFKKRTHPTPGNHEYAKGDTNGTGYFQYFGVAAHDQPTGWYSYDLGSWHIVVLNSSFEETEPLGRVLDLQTQLAWLQSDLAAHPATCTLAMWHHPRFSSGIQHGNDALMQPFWQVLYDAGADVILVGHEHNYERFAPQAPDGTADPARGIREFVVGTGGGGYDSLDVTKVTKVGNSEVGGVDHGVLKLTLSDGTYHWEFLPSGYTLDSASTPPEYSHTDSGTAACH